MLSLAFRSRMTSQPLRVPKPIQDQAPIQAHQAGQERVHDVKEAISDFRVLHRRTSILLLALAWQRSFRSSGFAGIYQPNQGVWQVRGLLILIQAYPLF